MASGSMHHAGGVHLISYRSALGSLPGPECSAAPPQLGAAGSCRNCKHQCAPAFLVSMCTGFFSIPQGSLLVLHNVAGDDAVGLSGPAGTAGCRDRQAGSRKARHEGVAAANAGEQSLNQPANGAVLASHHATRVSHYDLCMAVQKLSWQACVLTYDNCCSGCLQERLELQRQAEAEFNAERALVDEVVARIQQEDRMELAARRAKQADTKVHGTGLGQGG